MLTIFRRIYSGAHLWIALLLTATPCLASSISFAVIGDFGDATTAEADVAARVALWQPDFIITVGDNNYPNGGADTIDTNIGQYYHAFIAPYKGAYGAGSAANRLFPTLGNHDWGDVVPNPAGAEPYLSYFTLPGNGRYYEFARGPVHFFALDSDPNEPAGVTYPCTQSIWLQNAMLNATEPWKIVYFHHPPYSSGADHGSTDYMRWPFASWGATAVLAGHSHTYERLSEDGIPYFVNGLGGAGMSDFDPVPVSGSQFRYNLNFGAMLVTATESQITFQYITRAGTLRDTLVVPKPYTLSEAALAMRAAGGLITLDTAQAERISSANGTVAGTATLQNAIAIARKATGMEANP